MAVKEQGGYIDMLIDWSRGWDYREVVYGVVIAVACAIAAIWSGLFRRLSARIGVSRALTRYRKTIAEEASQLVVVGKRKGFTLSDVYIPLDMAESDLLRRRGAESDEERSSERAFVLVGGPGAGKSTTAKKRMLDALQERRVFPAFMRLRDYLGFEDIEAFIAHALDIHGVQNAEQYLRSQLLYGKCMCVLDGLDEVRPQLRDKAIADINAFYHKYFVRGNRLIVTCRKEAYRSIPLDIPCVMEVRPLTDEQIQRLAAMWPLGYPQGKTCETFWRDLATTQRVLELARSPLLLVGGLMQYTESNLGIPEARSEYLGRVARWLVTDWATAQGHPSDPYRQVYDRILARLALLMHRQERAEIPRATAEQNIGEWLPVFGFSSATPSDVLDSISTRTGILVSEVRESVVFAQFGLQEYFASLEVVEAVGVQGLASLEPRDWWREVILLAVAQQREPTEILTELFDKAPLMAAAAVAECPTPSVAVQERAVEACLTALDNGESAVGGALVPLLRRVRDRLELELCAALEERLGEPEARASVVGIALATAGTALATGALAKHPEVWDRCLEDAGFLSSSLENLLVDWIKKGTDYQSARAADMIAGRLSADRRKQLLDILPSLPAAKAEHLATLMLEQSSRVPRMRDVLGVGVSIRVVARCVPLIQDVEGFIRRQAERDERVRGAPRGRVYAGRHYPLEMDGRVSLVLTSLQMKDRSGNRIDEKGLRQHLSRSVHWATDRSRHWLLFVSSFAVATLWLPGPARLGILILLLGIGCLLAAAPHAKLPWERYSQGDDGISPSGGLLLMCGTGAACAGFFAADTSALQFALVMLSAASLITLGLVLETFAHFLYAEVVRGDVVVRRPMPDEKSFLFKRVYGASFLSVLLVAGLLALVMPRVLSALVLAVISLSAIHLGWTAYSILSLSWSHRALTQAHEHAEQEWERIVEHKEG